MSNHDLEIVRSYGQGCVPLRFGFCPYGSTSAGVIQPLIPSVVRDSLFGLQPRWGGAAVVHDGQFTGRYNILLDDDWQDFVSNPELRCNLNVQPATAFLPSTTTGSGLQLTAVQVGPGANLTIPVTEVVIATGGAGTTASVAISGNVVTLTVHTSTTNATSAAAINAATSTVGLTAAVIGTSSDVTYVAALTVCLTGGAKSPDEQYASLSLATAGAAGIQMVYTANQPGAAGNNIIILYAAGGAGTAASAAAVGNVITLTIDTSATVNTLLTAINVTALATVGALITASFTATANTEAAIHTALGTVAISSTSQNTAAQGTNLSGGGLLSARMSGASVADANAKSSNWGVQFYHLNVSVYAGDSLVDLSAQTELFIPSQGVLTSAADANSGILYKSLVAPAVATANILSVSGAGNGLTFNANEPGDAGNNIFIVYASPLASLFIPSTTGGSGNTFIAVPVGSAGRGVQISMSVPTGAATVITVTGSSVNIQPKASETVAGVTTAFNANAAAASLATASNTGTTSDLVTGNFVANLGGGYTQASATASAVQMSNPSGGYTIVVNFGTNCTNATVETAVNAIPGGVVTAVALGTTTDHVVATAATQLTGGTDPSDLTVQYVFTGSAATAAVLTSNAMVVTIATAGDTNANIAAAVNSAAGNNLMVAGIVGASADTNLPPQSGLVVSTTANVQQLAAQSLACHNIVALDIMARKSMNGVV